MGSSGPEKRQPAWLRALGRSDLPEQVEFGGFVYRRVQVFKHDFFAATGMYQGDGGKIVLKMGRQAWLLALPMAWIGRFLAHREVRLLSKAAGIEGVPRLVGRWSRTGFAHDYVEGRPLQKEDRPGDDFFPSLERLLDELHARDLAYVDLEKRENILLGEDGRPHLIDFQISYDLSRFGRRFWPARAMLRMLQRSDRYHLLKHWRRLRPDQLTEAQWREAKRPPFWISWHRRIFRPMTVLRRHVLVWLGGRETARGRSPG